jgi:hypothetical protein
VGYQGIPSRVILSGNKELAEQYIGEGHSLAQICKQSFAFQDLGYYRMRRDIAVSDDAAVQIQVTTYGPMADIKIHAPYLPALEKPVEMEVIGETLCVAMRSQETGNVVLLNPRTLEEEWSFIRNDNARPALAGLATDGHANVYVAYMDTSVTKLSKEGAELWTSAGTGDNGYWTGNGNYGIVVNAGLVFTSQWNSSGSVCVVARNAEDGSVEFCVELEEGDYAFSVQSMAKHPAGGVIVVFYGLNISPSRVIHVSQSGSIAWEWTYWYENPENPAAIHKNRKTLRDITVVGGRIFVSHNLELWPYYESGLQNPLHFIELSPDGQLVDEWVHPDPWVVDEEYELDNFAVRHYANRICADAAGNVFCSTMTRRQGRIARAKGVLMVSADRELTWEEPLTEEEQEPPWYKTQFHDLDIVYCSPGGHFYSRVYYNCTSDIGKSKSWIRRYKKAVDSPDVFWDWQSPDGLVVTDFVAIGWEPNAYTPDYDWMMFEAVNKQRRELAPQNALEMVRTSHGLIYDACMNHAIYLAENETTNHDNIEVRMNAVGAEYPESWISFGENVVYSSDGLKINEMVNWWMNSSGHRANILNPIWTSSCMAVANVGMKFAAVQVFWRFRTPWEPS